MPRTKLTLTRSERIEHVARAKRLRAMGVDIEVPLLPSSAAAVDFEIGFDYNFVFNSSPIHVTLVTSARIMSRRSGIYLTDNIGVTFPRETMAFDLWYQLGRGNRYWILSNLSFEYAQVLNHLLVAGMRLEKGKVFSGLLLLYTQGQLPTEYKHGAKIDLGITLYDSLGAGLTAQSMVFIDRQLETGWRKKLQTAKRRKSSSLYDGPPPFDIREEMRRRGAESSKTEARKLVVTDLKFSGNETGEVLRVAKDLKLWAAAGEEKNAAG